jgi:hypothetical protein
MTLPTSGPLSLSDIQGEFGGTNPISLSEYYAGGGLVPAGTTGTYGAVPSSGAISIQNFYGTTNVVISISDQNISYVSGGLSSATAGYRLTSGGQTDERLNNSYNNIGQWCTPTSQASNYEVFATLVYGALNAGVTGAWLALSSTQEWNTFANAGAYETAQITVQIRKVGTTTVLDTATITLEADAYL